MIPLRDSTRTGKTPYVNLTLIGINLAVFLFELSLSQNELALLFRRWGALPIRLGADIQSVAEVGLPPFLLTLITATFLHGGWFHVLSNMLYLWVFGDNVEARLGHFGYTIFYLIAGVSGFFAHALANTGSAVPAIGASGAIAGVLGAYLLLFPRARILTLIPVFIFLHLTELPAVVFLVFWFVLQLANGVMSLGAMGQTVAWWAHVGGFLSGVVIVYFLARDRMRPEIT